MADPRELANVTGVPAINDGIVAQKALYIEQYQKYAQANGLASMTISARLRKLRNLADDLT